MDQQCQSSSLSRESCDKGRTEKWKQTGEVRRSWGGGCGAGSGCRRREEPRDVSLPSAHPSQLRISPSLCWSSPTAPALTWDFGIEERRTRKAFWDCQGYQHAMKTQEENADSIIGSMQTLSQVSKAREPCGSSCGAGWQCVWEIIHPVGICNELLVVQSILWGEHRCWVVQRARDQEAEEVLSETEALLRKPGQVLQSVGAGWSSPSADTIQSKVEKPNSGSHLHPIPFLLLMEASQYQLTGILLAREGSKPIYWVMASAWSLLSSFWSQVYILTEKPLAPLIIWTAAPLLCSSGQQMEIGLPQLHVLKAVFQQQRDTAASLFSWYLGSFGDSLWKLQLVWSKYCSSVLHSPPELDCYQAQTQNTSPILQGGLPGKAALHSFLTRIRLWNISVPFFY